MKNIVAIIVLIVGFFFAIDLVSKHAMGGIEAGMGGGNGVYADYHKDNWFAYFLSGDEDFRPSDEAFENPLSTFFFGAEDGVCGADHRLGDCPCGTQKTYSAKPVIEGNLTANPFAK